MPERVRSRVGQTWSKFGPFRAKICQNSSKSGQVWSMLDQSCGQDRAQRLWPKLVALGPKLVCFGPNLAESGQTHRRNLVELGPKLVYFGPNLVWPRLQTGGAFGPNLAPGAGPTVAKVVLQCESSRGARSGTLVDQLGAPSVRDYGRVGFVCGSSIRAPRYPNTPLCRSWFGSRPPTAWGRPPLQAMVSPRADWRPSRPRKPPASARSGWGGGAPRVPLHPVPSSPRARLDTSSPRGLAFSSPRPRLNSTSP